MATATTAKYTPAQIARVRDGLRKAGHPTVDELSDEDAVAAYLAVAQPDDFSAELQKAGDATGDNAPGFEPNNAQDAGKEMYAWAGQFKTKNGRAPTRQDFVDAWGDFGGQIVDWVVSTGTWPDEATFTQRAAQTAMNTPPGGSIGKTYAPQTSIESQRFDWEKDFQERKFAADEAKRKSDEARAQGDTARADAYLKLATDAQNQANAIQIAGMTGVYNGNPTLAMQQFTQNQANFEKQFGLTVDQFNFQKEQFGKNFGLSEAGVTGMYNGAPTEQARQFNISTQQRQDETAYNAARAGLFLKANQAMGGIGAPLQNYEGLTIGQGVAPGYTPAQGQMITGEKSGPYMQQQPNIAPGYQQGQQQGYQAPQMPRNIQAVLSGAPLPAYGIGQQAQNTNAPGAPYTLRAAGAQAQANEGSLGKQGRYEAYELAGVRGEDLADNEARIRKNLGSGLQSASYR